MKLLQAFCLSLLILAAGCATDSTKPVSSKALIYYVPFQFDPNELITPANIREKSNSVELTDKRSISSLEKLLDKSKAASDFDANRVRFQILLERPDRAIFVDNEGNLLEGTRQRRLEPKKFDALQELIAANVTTGGGK